MAYRGRLIFSFLAELYRLDTVSTAADPDGAGPLESGYDPDFREPIYVPQAGQQVGTSARKEHDPVLIPCQVRTSTFEALQQMMAGDVPQSEISLIFHFRDLENMGLVDSATGEALIRKGDRLASIKNQAGALVQAVRTPPGLYITEARPTGFGLDLSDPHRNLLLVIFEDREQGVST